MTTPSRTLSAAILCLVMLLSGSVMMAQDPAMPAKDTHKKAEKMKTSTISGTVSAISDSALTIVDSAKAEHTLTVTTETKVTKSGKEATLADVKTNDNVTVEAKKGEGDTWTALKISVS